MDVTLYYLLHVAAGFVLVGLTFQACASPTPQTRSRVLMVGGIASLVMLVGGFGLLAKLELGFPGWVLLKLACWLVLSALAGFAFRRPAMAGGFRFLALVAVLAAVWAVYYKPF